MAPKNGNTRRGTQPSQKPSRKVNKRNNSQRRQQTATARTEQNSSKPRHFGCGICKADHRIVTCKQFVNLNLAQKYKMVHKLHYCSNCLARNHLLKDCKNQARCNTCGRKHHTVLHGHEKILNNLETEIATQPPRHATKLKNLSASTSSAATSSTTTIGIPSSFTRTFVPTAEVFVESEEGCISVRAILNPSLTTSRVSASLVRKYNFEVFQIGDQSFVKLTITPNMNSCVKYNLCMLVVKDLPRRPYSTPFKESVKDKFDRISLADPNFTSDSSVFVEIGGDLYTTIIKTNTIHIDGGTLVAQDSTLGWLVMGSFSG